MSNKYLTIKETAKLLGVHWQTIRNYIKQDKLPYIRIGRNFRIDINDIHSFTSNNTQEKRKAQIEIEHRYILTDRKKIENNVRNMGAKLTNHSRIIDHWYAPDHVNNMEDNQKFYESSKGYSLRIREMKNNYSGRTTTTLEIKKLADGKSHSKCIEQEILIPDFKQTAPLLDLLNYKKVIAIDKERLLYQLDGIKYVFDDIKDLCTGLEIEIKSSLPEDVVETQLYKSAKKIGLKKEDREEKSLTYLAFQKFAKF